MWWWIRVEKISWTARVKSEEILHGVKGDRSVILFIQ
jgi:hypothetical protein